MAKSTVALSATGQAVVGKGKVHKVIVNTHSSGVIKLVDSPNSTAGRVILSDYTLPAGAQVLELNLEYYEGVHFVLVSGTATVQIATDLI
jgi:hypothetical protein